MRAETYPFVPKSLPYEVFELAPFIDMETMKLHYGRHYMGHVDNLNRTLKDYPTLNGKSRMDLLLHPENLPKQIRGSVVCNCSGMYFHELYFEGMTGENPGMENPQGDLAEAIYRDFGSLHDLKEVMQKKAMKLCGSGWLLLVTDKEGNLSLGRIPNLELPDLNRVRVVLALDLWEHAYYLQYHYKRQEYVCKWFQLINWKQAQKRYENRNTDNF